ncbi:Bmp-binding endothelial regulator protein-like [Plakobranchus ocellatus]|uniref:Bmp-binding endothelial regulator protein-like n=1 Tax=Plakobranchus ocellatus TaxID=259542 RepID=A0AAV4DF38_9GAST|nr:Bmp-binding endothelial regulator protein-like [Plakobranchus ocellatus]
MCRKRACPVLNCPDWATHKLPGHKCPSCKGERTIFDVPGSCYLSHHVYGQGDRHNPDICTSCVCQQGTMLCEREQCSQLDCPFNERVLPPGACCPICLNQRSCDANGRKIKHGGVWYQDACSRCTCYNGAWECSHTKCPALSCAKGFVVKPEEKSCCPTCVQEHATCSVRGKSSDRIETFGKLVYRTQGYCLHELVKDCGQETFSIKVKYDKMKSNAKTRGQVRSQARSQVMVSNQLDLVSIRFGSTNVKLFRSGKIRVNRTSGNLKTNHKIQQGKLTSASNLAELIKNRDGAAPKKLSVSVRGQTVSVRLLTLGVMVTWNIAKNNLKVKVDAQRYLGDRRLCGLCGSVILSESTNLTGNEGSGITRNKRFEPALPSYMAWAWRRGQICKERNKAALHELRREAVSDNSRFDTEVIALLNKLGQLDNISTGKNRPVSDNNKNDDNGEGKSYTTVVDVLNPEPSVKQPAPEMSITEELSKQEAPVGKPVAGVQTNSDGELTTARPQLYSDTVIKSSTAKMSTADYSFPEHSARVLKAFATQADEVPSCLPTSDEYKDAEAKCRGVRDHKLQFCSGPLLVDTFMRVRREHLRHTGPGPPISEPAMKSAISQELWSDLVPKNPDIIY